MRVLFFGTFDEQAHPRVLALRQGMVERGHEVDLVNAPLGVSTASRVQMARNPLRAPLLLLRVLRSWVSLWVRARGQDPDIVVVGYLGHLDVHLARRRFPDRIIVLDHMVSLGDTVRDRLGARSPVARLLDLVDRRALRAADVVLVDTEEQAASLPTTPRAVCVVPVTAPWSWLRTPAAGAPKDGAPVRVVFFGLYTPLQGAPAIGEAIGRLSDDRRLEFTMIGTGQDRAETQRLASESPWVRWIDWVDADDLPDVVSDHHVCLGIFGTGSKAQRVVPNKLLQGGAAGCALLTSDTEPQRRVLRDAACFVPAGSGDAIADALRQLAGAPDEIVTLQEESVMRLRQQLTARRVLAPLDALLAQLVGLDRWTP